MFDITLAHQGLLVSLPFALLLCALLWALSQVTQKAGRNAYGDKELVDQHSPSTKLRWRLLVLTGDSLLIALLILAALGLQLPAAPQKVYAGSLEVELVYDVGLSMQVPDYCRYFESQTQCQHQFFEGQGSRLDEARSVTENDILQAIDRNEIGIVTFNGAGFPLGDLTTDSSYTRWLLDNWVYIGNAPRGSDQLGLGLQTAIDEFTRFGKPGRDKVIVLFSDGDDAGDPSVLAHDIQEINSLHIRLVIIGLGGAPAPIPLYDNNGQYAGNYKDQNGATALVEINEDHLRFLAHATAGGEYIHLDPNHLPTINWPSRLASQADVVPEKTDISWYLGLTAAVLLVVLETRGLTMGSASWLANRRKRKRTDKPTSKTGGGGG